MKALEGKRKLAAPLAVALVLPLLFALLFYPTANMEMKGLPFGVLSLDAGAQTPLGEKNLGSALVEKVESGDFASAFAGASAGASADAEVSEGEGGESGAADMADALSFTAYDSEEALQEAFEGNELYGAIVIPEDFTASQMSSMRAAMAGAGAGADASAVAGADASALAAMASSASGSADASAQAPEALAALAAGRASGTVAASNAAVAAQEAASDAQAPTIKIVVDYAKSPLVAVQMQSGLASALSGAGANVEVEVINQGPAAELSGTNIMAGMLSQMIVLMPLLVCSVVAGVLGALALAVRDGKTAGQRMKRFALCLVVYACAALVSALMLYWVLSCVAGLAADMGAFVGFAWLAAFFLMTFFGGLACIRGRLGAAAGALIILLGMTSAYLPFEALPEFWQDWVCPWAPELYLGDGLRSVVFRGAGPWNGGTLVAGIYALVGVVCGIAASLKGSNQG